MKKIIELQKLKTRVIYNDVNPEWNEDLTLSVTDPSLKVLLVSNVHVKKTPFKS